VLGLGIQWPQRALRAFAPLEKHANALRSGVQPRVAVDRGAKPQDTVFKCDRVRDWLLEDCNNYRSMHVRRPQCLRAMQHHVDLLDKCGALGHLGSVHEEIRVAQLRGSEELVAAEWSAKSRRLLGNIGGPGLPDSLSEQISRDINEVGAVMAKMFPAAEVMALTLQLLGENCCTRWHQDHYTARVIITYNGPGTVYVHHDNVDFWELDNGGSNDHIIRDVSQVMSASVGDVLFMKGKLFPHAANGLVHKSPERRYHPEGAVMNRLCLKVDVK